MTRTAKPKLPWQQLMILSVCRIADPVAHTSVFPYLPEMVESFHVPQVEVATWAGITSACFSLSQAVTGIACGRFSDMYGRKPMIVSGLFFTMVTVTLFGFSQNLAWAIMVRSFAGAWSGTVGIIRTTVAEMVPEKELQPRAFSIIPLIWSMGSIIGPVLGGGLAKPAEKFPEIFDTPFFNKFPFALPNLVAAVLFANGVVFGILFLRETLDSKKDSRDYGLVLGRIITGIFRRNRDHNEGKRAGEEESLLTQSKKKKKQRNLGPPAYSEVFTKQSNLALTTYSILSLHSVTYDQLLPVYLHTDLQDRIDNPDVSLPFKFIGGFGINSGRIGALFTAYGVVSMFIQFLVFPPVARRYGVLNSFRVTSLFFPLVYMLTPFTCLLPTPRSREIGIFCLMVIKSFGGVFGFPCTIILLTNSAQSIRLLGTLNGVSTSISALGRAAGPYFGGWLFTNGQKLGYGILPWWILAFVALLGHISSWWQVEMEGFGAEESDDEENNEDLGKDAAAEPTTLSRIHSGAGDSATAAPSDARGIMAPLALQSSNSSAAIEDYDSGREDESSQLLAGRGRTYDGSQGGDDSPKPRLERVTSSPIGIRQPISKTTRRYSSGLGQSNNGFGIGGSSFH